MTYIASRRLVFMISRSCFVRMPPTCEVSMPARAISSLSRSASFRYSSAPLENQQKNHRKPSKTMVFHEKNMKKQGFQADFLSFAWC